MKKIFFLLFPMLVLFAGVAHAHCPLCTAAVGTAAVTAKYFGVDTSIIGVMIGAFGISTGLWVALAIKKKFKFIKFQTPLIVLASFLLTVIPLMPILSDTLYFPALFFGQPGSIFNQVHWINKMMLGSVLGGIAALAAYFAHNKVKAVRGRVLFPYQGIAFTLAALIVTSLSLYLMVR